MFSNELKGTKFKLGDVSFIITSYNTHLNMTMDFRVIYENLFSLKQFKFLRI
jgi:hypothetical protein